MCAVHVAFHTIYYLCQACTIQYIQNFLHIRSLWTLMSIKTFPGALPQIWLFLLCILLCVGILTWLTHGHIHCWLGTHTGAWCSDWDMLMEGQEKAQTGPGQTYPGCYWWNWYQVLQVQIGNSVCAGTSHWLLSYWMVVLRLKTLQPHLLTPFHVLDLYWGVTPFGTVVIGFGLSTDYFPVGKWLWGHWNKSHTLHDILWITIHATSSQIIVIIVTVTVLSSCKKEALSLDLLEFLLHLGLLLFILPLQLISDAWAYLALRQRRQENCLGTYIITIYKECTGKPQGNIMALPDKALPYLFSPVMYIHNSTFLNRALQIGTTGLLLQGTIIIIIVLLRVSDNIHLSRFQPHNCKKKTKKTWLLGYTRKRGQHTRKFWMQQGYFKMMFGGPIPKKDGLQDIISSNEIAGFGCLNSELGQLPRFKVQSSSDWHPWGHIACRIHTD